jgi:hypothetical protein
LYFFRNEKFKIPAGANRHDEKSIFDVRRMLDLELSKACFAASRRGFAQGDGKIQEAERCPFALTALGRLYLPFASSLSTEPGVAIFHAQAYIPT